LEFSKELFTIVLRNDSYMSKKTIKPTGKELEILQIIWGKEAVSVKEVHEALGGESSNGYTTILKLMQIMHEKGLVTRQKNGKLHLYKAVPTQEKTRQQMVNKMIETVFQGSATQLVMSALGNGKSSREELQEIKKYLEKLEGGKS
jgi:BlaI family transcriptional regulator, penicillinase repressor